MADTADLKHMIMSFRVSELQVLLGFAGRNKSGRKQELLQRALQLVQKGCTMPVQIKIRELYRRRYPGGPGTSPPQARPPTDAPPPTAGLGTCYGSYTSDPAGPIDFSNKHLPSSHPDPTPSGLPVHPDVRFKHLPFYDVLGELMKPTSLVPKNNGRFQESYFVFHLTPQQAQDIAMSRDFRPGAKCEYTVQVQLRFCLLETSCEQDDNFPPSICVRVNGKMAPLPNPIPTSKPGIEPKRPGRPVDITSICRLSPTVSNQLDVSWASEFGRGYCLAIYLVRRLTSDILLQRLKQFGNRHPDHTRALIKEKLAHDPESEIATTSLRVSLICPLGKMRMQIPCRSSTCTHLQCFDATTFLMMNEKKPTWVCPVCDKPAPFDKLLIDGYFVEIFRKSPEGSEIQFHEDGSWSPMKQSKETHVISSPSVKASSSTASATAPSTSDKGSSKKSVEVIDLTLESSDEEENSPPASVSSGRPSEQGTHRTPPVSPVHSNISTPNSLGSPVNVKSPVKLDSPCGLRSPCTPASPQMETFQRLRSPNHKGSPSHMRSPSSMGSPNPIGSPNQVVSPTHVVPPNQVAPPNIEVPPNQVLSPTHGLRPNLVLPPTHGVSPNQLFSQNHMVPPKKVLSPTNVLPSKHVLPPNQVLPPNPLSPNHLGSPKLSDFPCQMRLPNHTGVSKFESQLHSPNHYVSPVKYELPLNIYSPCKRESPTKLSSPPSKQKSPGPKSIPSYPMTTKMYPPFAVPLPSMITSPLNMMAGVPSLLACPTMSRPPSVSLASSLMRNGVSNSHHAFSVPSFDDDLLPILTPNDEIPDFLSQSTSMLSFQPSSSTSSAQHTFTMHNDLIPLD